MKRFLLLVALAVILFEGGATSGNFLKGSGLSLCEGGGTSSNVTITDGGATSTNHNFA